MISCITCGNRGSMKSCSDKALITLEGIDLTEPYGLHLNFDYTDKMILDIGADTGTTAEFFINRGAKYVWCVEGDQRRCEIGAENLKALYMDKAQMIPAMMIKTPYDFDMLFSLYGYTGPQETDLIKIDIEGWECCLLSMNEDILAAQKEFIIDIHGKILTKLIGDKLVRLGYKLMDDVIGDTIHAIKKP